MRVTMKDVARKANVSTATVSLVLNNEPGISSATRDHVSRIIEELKYTPDVQARRLSSGRSGTVGLVMPPWSAAFFDPYFLNLMQGTLEAVRDRGYQLLLEVCDDRFLEHRLWHDLFAGKRVDGLLIATPYLDQSYLAELAVRGSPTLLINGERPDLPALDHVGYDDTQCGLDATRYLYSLGHRRIAHMAGDLNHASAVHRLAGYKSALAELELAYRPDYVVVGDFMPVEAREALQSLLALPVADRPTALFCANDTMAQSVITHLKERGYRVPEDFSVLGVDDNLRSATFDPPLTTYRQDLVALGQRAATLFLEKLEHKRPTQRLLEKVPMERIDRATCAPLPTLVRAQI